MRLFIAVPLPEHIKKKLATLQDRAAHRSTGERVSWVSPEKMHLTLVFLGEKSRGEIEDIKSAMENSVENEGKFKIYVSGTGAFPSGKRPRVIWIGCLDSTGTLDRIRRKLVSALAKKTGYKKKKRKFIPHLTLGRIKKFSGSAKSVEFLMSEDIQLGDFTVERIQLIKSKLKPEGAVYSVVEDAKI